MSICTYLSNVNTCLKKCAWLTHNVTMSYLIGLSSFSKSILNFPNSFQAYKLDFFTCNFLEKQNLRTRVPA